MGRKRLVPLTERYVLRLRAVVVGPRLVGVGGSAFILLILEYEHDRQASVLVEEDFVNRMEVKCAGQICQAG